MFVCVYGWILTSLFRYLIIFETYLFQNSTVETVPPKNSLSVSPLSEWQYKATPAVGCSGPKPRPILASPGPSVVHLTCQQGRQALPCNGPAPASLSSLTGPAPFPLPSHKPVTPSHGDSRFYFCSFS